MESVKGVFNFKELNVHGNIIVKQASPKKKPGIYYKYTYCTTIADLIIKKILPSYSEASQRSPQGEETVPLPDELQERRLSFPPSGGGFIGGEEEAIPAMFPSSL